MIRFFLNKWIPWVKQKKYINGDIVTLKIFIESLISQKWINTESSF